MNNVCAEPVILLGMHRAGTSTVSRALQSLGVQMGERFIAAQPDNPRGFWEDPTPVAISSAVLDRLALQWDSTIPISVERFDEPALSPLYDEGAAYLRRRCASGGVWGFKDPRTLRVLPFWERLFEACALTPRYVLALRSPASVARSIVRRDNRLESHGRLLWYSYYLSFFDQWCRRLAVIVDYDRLVDDPCATFPGVNGALQLVEPERVADCVQDFEMGFLDPHLRHASHSKTAEAQQPDFIDAAYAALQACAEAKKIRGAAAEAHLAALEKHARHYRELLPALLAVDEFAADKQRLQEVIQANRPGIYLGAGLRRLLRWKR